MQNLRLFIADAAWAPVSRRRSPGSSWARRFYFIIGISTAAGIALDFAKKLLAPVLLVGVLLVASSRKLMEKQPSSVIGRVAVGLATLLMFGAAVGMFVF